MRVIPKNCNGVRHIPKNSYIVRTANYNIHLRSLEDKYKSAAKDEKEIMPVALNFVQSTFKNYMALEIPNYTDEQDQSKAYQNAGIDIMLLDGNINPKDRKEIYIDVKCSNCTKMTLITFELEVKDTTGRPAPKPWAEYSEELPKDSQWILFASKERMILIQKKSIWSLKEKYPDLFNNLEWIIDKDKSNLFKKNLLLKMQEPKEFAIIKELNPFIYELNNSKWKLIKYKNMLYLPWVQ